MARKREKPSETQVVEPRDTSLDQLALEALKKGAEIVEESKEAVPGLSRMKREDLRDLAIRLGEQRDMKAREGEELAKQVASLTEELKLVKRETNPSIEQPSEREISEEHLAVLMKLRELERNELKTSMYIDALLEEIEQLRDPEHGERLQWEVNHDDLTRSLNKRGFESVTRRKMNEYKRTQELKRRHGEEEMEFVLFVLDLDYLKELNTKFGHAGANEVLKRFAQSLQEVVRDADVVGRWGGDEFVISAVTKKSGDRVKLSKRIIDAIRAKPALYEGKEIPFTASIGMAKLHDGESLEDLFKRADLAALKAKENGRDQVAIPEDEE